MSLRVRVPGDRRGCPFLVIVRVGMGSVGGCGEGGHVN